MMDATKKGMGKMLKKFHVEHEGTGIPIFVGYEVKDLEELKEMGFKLTGMYEPDFIKAQKRGPVYVQREGFDYGRDTVFLFDCKGSWICAAHKITQ